MADALSRRSCLLTTLHTEVIGFEHLKELYVDDEDFQSFWQKCLKHEVAGDYHIQ